MHAGVKDDRAVVRDQHPTVEIQHERRADEQVILPPGPVGVVDVTDAIDPPCGLAHVLHHRRFRRGRSDCASAGVSPECRITAAPRSRRVQNPLRAAPLRCVRRCAGQGGPAPDRPLGRPKGAIGTACGTSPPGSGPANCMTARAASCGSASASGRLRTRAAGTRCPRCISSGDGGASGRGSAAFIEPSLLAPVWLMAGQRSGPGHPRALARPAAMPWSKARASVRSGCEKTQNALSRAPRTHLARCANESGRRWNNTQAAALWQLRFRKDRPPSLWPEAAPVSRRDAWKARRGKCGMSR